MIRGCCVKIPRALNLGRVSSKHTDSLLSTRSKGFVRQLSMGDLKSKESRGALIVLEGLDRCGKTSQSSRLVSSLEGHGHSVELWRFPDRTTGVGQMISSYLANQTQLDDHTIHLLFSANRWEKRSLMESKLRSGTTLILDRYSYSGVAFSQPKDSTLSGARRQKKDCLLQIWCFTSIFNQRKLQREADTVGKDTSSLSFKRRFHNSIK